VDLQKAFDSCSVTIVCGQTDCGKSTQVPQYVLEDYIEMGKVAECNIICSQSRRVSAIGLADHVSKERSQAASETVSLFIIGLSQFQSMDVSSCMSSYRSNSPTGA
jgi:ATP-dependent RNA helicase DHX57